MKFERPKSDCAAGNRYRFARFVAVGGIAAAVNILSRIAFNLVMSFQAAIVMAFVCGVTTAYLLNRMFVFTPSGRPIHDEFLRFTFINVMALAQVWIVSVGLAFYIFPAIGYAWHAETVAHVIGVVIPTFTSYLGHRYFSFAAPQ